MAEVRLQKAMADAGVASQRASEKLILEGRVKVNGRCRQRARNQGQRRRCD